MPSTESFQGRRGRGRTYASACACALAPAALAALASASPSALASASMSPPALAPPPTSANCTTTWFEQTVDHFTSLLPPENGGNYSWRQRVLVCDQFFTGVGTGTIFFYTGNEGDVTLYANNSGLMWQNAARLGALLIFAEHRYYGASWPLSGDPAASLRHMQFLSSAQALADYATLLRSIKRGLGPGGEQVPTIAFGGSYGGVLSAMLRLKYPGTVDGAISASAPLRAFPTQLPPWDSSSYYARITADASSAGGSPDACAANIRSMWSPFFADGATAAGRKRLGDSFMTCAPLASPDDATALAFWVRGAFDTLSMANFPWPSSYITGGGATLPAFPVRVACGFLAEAIPDPAMLYVAVRNAVAVLVNASGDAGACFEVDPNPYSHPGDPYDGTWDYQQCTEMQPDSMWFSANGVTDMFWPLPANATFLSEHCKAAWGVTVTEQSRGWMATSFDFPSLRGGGSNIVFSSGSYDPWGSATFLETIDASRYLVALQIEGAAHHLDLMFSHPEDPPAVTAARAIELDLIEQWVRSARERV